MKQQAIQNIQADKLYSPNEIVALKVIQNTSGGYYAMTIYRLIGSGRLKAVNMGVGPKRARYMVKGSDLIEFLNNDVYGKVVGPTSAVKE